MEAGVGDKETKRTKWRETRAATHSEQEQAKVNPRRENHFTAVTETTEWWGLRKSMQSGRQGGNCIFKLLLEHSPQISSPSEICAVHERTEHLVSLFRFRWGALLGDRLGLFRL